MAYTAAKPLAHRAHCRQAQGLLLKMLLGHGLYSMLPPGLWPAAYAAARPMAYCVHCCQAYGLFSSRPLGSNLLSSGPGNCDLLSSVRLHSSLPPVTYDVCGL